MEESNKKLSVTGLADEEIKELKKANLHNRRRPGAKKKKKEDTAKKEEK